MSENDYEDFYELPEYNGEAEKAVDEYFLNAQEEIKGFYEVNKESVFFIRQLQVKLEKKYYHWVTNNAIIELHLDCPRAIPGGIIDRFDRWDQKRGKGVNSGRNSQEVGVNLVELLGKT